MLLPSHKAIIWCAFGVARLNSRGRGGRGWTGLKGPAWRYTGFEEFLYQLLVPVIQGLVSRSSGWGGGVVSSLIIIIIIIIITLFNEGRDIDYWSPSSFHNGPPTIKVVAKTHGYHLVFIWGSYIKFQGRGGLD